LAWGGNEVSVAEFAGDETMALDLDCWTLTILSDDYWTKKNDNNNNNKKSKIKTNNEKDKFTINI